MTDQQLFEICHMTNGTDGGYMSTHNATFQNLSYAPSALSSLHNPPVSPHFAQDALKSPITPCNDLSPQVEMPKPGGGWLNNHLGRTTSCPWMSSPQSDGMDVGNQVNQHPRMYPYSSFSLTNPDMSSKPHALPRLDSFTQAFPNQNLGVLRCNSLSTDNGSPSGLEDSPMLLSPQAGSPIDHALFSQSTNRFNQLLMNPSQPPQSHQSVDQITSPLLGRPQNQYGYQQQAGHVTDTQQMYQSQQHTQQSNQSLPRPRFLALSQHHQSVHPQLQGPYSQTNEREAQDSHPPPPSPQGLSFYYGQNCKGPDQQTPFTSTTHQPPALYQESQSYLHLPPHHNSYQPPQAQMLPDSHHSLSAKHHGLDRQNSGSLSSPTMQGLCSSPLDRVSCGDYNPSQSQRDSSHCCLPPHHPVPGRRDLQQPSNSMQWPTIVGGASYLQDPVSPHCMPRPETIQRKMSGAKLKCSVCQREFKSLPALNGHMRSHGGFKTHLPAARMKEEAHELQRSEVTPMVMPVSVPVKPPPPPIRFSPILQFPEMGRDPEDLTVSYPRPVCGQRPMSPSTSTHLPPLQIPAPEPQRDSCEEEESIDMRPERKKVQHRLLPLFIPSPSPFPVARGAVLFRSQLRTPGSEGDIPYTPPPMLSPIRPGSGLFSSMCGVDIQSSVMPIPTRVQLCKSSDHPTHSDDLDRSIHIETPGQRAPIRIEPRINIGDHFQADIPCLLSKSQASKDPHKATLVWSSWNNLDKPCEQQKVDDLLRLACCSVLPGGGTNTELALHCLFQCKGDVMATVEKLLTMDQTRAVSEPLANYHYAGSDKWTIQERRQLNKALDKHHKDFFLVQKMVRTKTVPQCVEFYYTWKRRSRGSKRLNVGLATPVAENEVNWEDCRLALLKPSGLDKKKATDFADCSDCLTTSLGYEELSNISVLDGDGEAVSPVGRRSRLSAERSLPQSGQHLAPTSLKSSPAHSTTSGDTDTMLPFPCRECGKAFLKVKSRNAHMKTHRQQETPLSWSMHVPRPLEDSLDITPASPYQSPPHPPLLSGNHMSGLQGPQIWDVKLHKDEGRDQENTHVIQASLLG